MTKEERIDHARNTLLDLLPEHVSAPLRNALEDLMVVHPNAHPTVEVIVGRSEDWTWAVCIDNPVRFMGRSTTLVGAAQTVRRQVADYLERARTNAQSNSADLRHRLEQQLRIAERLGR